LKVKPTDGVTFSAVAFGLLRAALLACYIPPQSDQVDPLAAL
jgi:hypothetical protein